MADTATLAALGTTPIAGASAAGASARYEPEFDKLSTEIAKLESVEGRSSLRWNEVVGNASAILGSKSKDLLVASYLTMGLYQEDGYGGLAAGLQVCRDMMNTFWENLFPEKTRLRARGQALQWLADRLAPVLVERSGASKSDKEALTSCVALLNDLSSASGEKLQDAAPNLAELQRAVQDKLDSVPADEPPPSSEPAPSESTPASSGDSAPAAAQERAIDSPDAAREALAGFREKRIKAAQVLRETNPAEPWAYRLLREAVWEDLVEAPAANKEGVTEVSGGDASFVSQMEARLEKGDSAGVVADCESRLPSDRLWLDLSFFSYRAMEDLGKSYTAARKAVGDEVARLVRSFPSLLEIKFADGTMMASETARLWIQNELAALPRKGDAGAGTLDAAVAEARKLVSRKKLQDAMALLQKELRAAATRRDRFLCRHALARLCLDAGRADLALPQLEGLDEEAKKFALEEWEPSLFAELLRDLFKCHKGSATPEKANDYYNRLCRLDLSAALAADGKK